MNWHLFEVYMHARNVMPGDDDDIINQIMVSQASRKEVVAWLQEQCAKVLPSGPPH